jgi:HSP20 family protein
MPECRIKVAPDTVAYTDEESHKLVVEFAIPGAPMDTIDVKILENSLHLTAPASDIDYVAALALGWPVKTDKAEATYDDGLLRIEMPIENPMEDAVKVTIRAGGVKTKTNTVADEWALPAPAAGSESLTSGGREINTLPAPAGGTSKLQRDQAFQAMVHQLCMRSAAVSHRTANRQNRHEPSRHK